jgi:hypothetical protein
VNVVGTIYVLGGADRAGAISNQGLVFFLKRNCLAKKV